MPGKEQEMTTTHQVAPQDSDHTKRFQEEYEKAMRKLLEAGKITEAQAERWIEQSKDPEQKNALHFPSDEAAKSFFQAQATNGLPFCVYDVDENGKALGTMWFSNGDGQLYKPDLGPELATSVVENWDAIHSNPDIKEKVFEGLKNSDNMGISLALGQLKTAQREGSEASASQPEAPKSDSSSEHGMGS